VTFWDTVYEYVLCYLLTVLAYYNLVFLFHFIIILYLNPYHNYDKSYCMQLTTLQLSTTQLLATKPVSINFRFLLMFLSCDGGSGLIIVFLNYRTTGTVPTVVQKTTTPAGGSHMHER